MTRIVSSSTSDHSCPCGKDGSRLYFVGEELTGVCESCLNRRGYNIRSGDWDKQECVGGTIWAKRNFYKYVLLDKNAERVAVGHNEDQIIQELEESENREIDASELEYLIKGEGEFELYKAVDWFDEEDE